LLRFRCALRDFYQRLRGTDRRSAGVASRVGETAWRTRNGVVGRSLRQALYLCGALSLVGIAILLSPVPLLRWTEVPPALRVEVGNYLAVLALALPPALLAVMVEVTSLTLMALFIARQGTTASAAHQIASNLAALLYMVPLSLAIATSARVSYWLGA
jgi:multidrug resistance protein, MATE family